MRYLIFLNNISKYYIELLYKIIVEIFIKSICEIVKTHLDIILKKSIRLCIYQEIIFRLDLPSVSKLYLIHLDPL